MKTLKITRIIALCEGISYILFAITMPLKYSFDIVWPNKIVGMGHGILFLAYLAFIYILSTEHKFNLKQLVQLYSASIIPFGTFYIDKKILKNTEI